MSGRKYCRICVNEVLETSTYIHSNGAVIKKLLVNILPGMNTSLTNSVSLCQECFDNVNFAYRVKEAFREKEKIFLESNYGNYCTRSYCGLCFKFENILLLHHLTEAIKGVIEIALSEFITLNTSHNICGICWSWIKKIYFFKKRCFKMEENLKSFCSKNNVPAMTDLHLEYFLSGKDFIKTGKILKPKENESYMLKSIYNSDLVDNTKEVTKEMFSNVSKELPKKLENDGNFREEKNFTYEDKIVTSQNVESEHDFIFKIIETAHNVDEYETQIDADDEFDEHFEREIETSEEFVIILSDNEDDMPANLSTKELVSTNFKRTCVSAESNKTDNDDINEQNPKNNSLTHLISNNENNKLESSKEHWYTSYNNNNSYPIKKPMKSLDFRTSSKCRIIAANNKKLHKSRNKVKDKKGHSKICQEEDNDNNYCNHSLGSGELSMVSDQGIRNLPYGNSSYTHVEINDNEVTKNNFKNQQDILNHTSDLIEMHLYNNIPNQSNEVICSAVTECEDIFKKKTALNDNLLQLDEDCYEIVTENNNSIDLSNVSSHDQEIEAEYEGDEHANELWGCHVCVAKFTHKRTARKHMELHEEPWNKYGRYNCTKCAFRTNWKGSLTKHEALHTKRYFCKTIMYLCPYCSNVSNTRRDIQAHISEHVISWKKFQCGDCMFTTNGSEKLRMHYERCHS